MTQPSPSDPAAVAVELERIRRTIDVGFTRTDGTLALLVQRHDQTDAQLADHEHRLDALERGETDRQRHQAQRLDALDARRIPWKLVGSVVAVAAFAVTVWQTVPH